MRTKPCSEQAHLLLLENVRQAALAAILAIMVLRHEHAGAALLMGAFTAGTFDLAVIANFVELQNGKRDVLLLMLVLLRLGVRLLFVLLATTIKTNVRNEGVLSCNENKPQNCLKPRPSACIFLGRGKEGQFWY